MEIRQIHAMPGSCELEDDANVPNAWAKTGNPQAESNELSTDPNISEKVKPM
jgi:hypothetical protein